MTEPQAWMNGKQVAFSQMRLPVWDLGVVAGASLAEMARTYAHQPFRLPQHLDRLLSSCRELGFDAPFSTDELLSAAEQIVAHNASLIAQGDDLGIVIFVTAGSNRTYLGEADLPGPTVGIHTFPLPFALWHNSLVNGVQLVIPERRQIDSDSLPVHRKTRNRLHWWLADREANAVESGSRALLLDREGRITETSTACFYGVIDGEIVTPQHNVLDSMSRRMVQEAANAAGLTFRAADITVEDLAGMQNAFMSSTPVGVLPVRSIVADRSTIKASSTETAHNVSFPVDDDSTVLQLLRNYWKKQTGVDPSEQIRIACAE